MDTQFDIVKSLLGMTLIGAQWILWLLLGLSVVSLAVILERILFFVRCRQNFAQFNALLNEFLQKNAFEQAEGLCASQNSLAAQTALQGLRNRHKGRDAMEGSMEGLIVGERTRLDRGLVILGTLGNNAPFIGLFGTVIGIIKAFHDLAINPQGGPSVVMTGISEALVATAVGLMVALPAVIAFNAFNRIVKKHIANAQSIAKLLLVYKYPTSSGEKALSN